MKISYSAFLKCYLCDKIVKADDGESPRWDLNT